VKVCKLYLKVRVLLVFVFLFGSAKIGHPAIMYTRVAHDAPISGASGARDG